MSAAERGLGGGSGGPGGGPADEPVGGRKARGRPRLTESDRARRRLESRKKYDVRRVYLGEAHGPWVDLRRRSGWSDAKLAAYLLGLERGQRAGRRGKPWEQIPKIAKRKKRRRRNVNCLRHAALWYQDHRGRCPAEPRLAELEPALGLSSTAVWQCERGHRYFQDLHPPRTQSDSDSDSGGDSGSSSSSSSEAAPRGAPPAAGGAEGPGQPPSGGRGAALEAVLCVGLGPPVPLGPPLLILATPPFEALGGLQLDVGGAELPCALLDGGGALPSGPPAPKTEEQQEVPGLKQEEPPVPTVEPPLEPPQDPLPEEDGLTIVYEIPREPLRRRSRRGRAPPPPSGGLPEPIGDAPPPKRGRFRSSCQASRRSLQLRRQMLVASGTREFPCDTCGKSFKRKNHLDVHRRTHSGETPVECQLCGFRCRQRASLTWHMRHHGGAGGAGGSEGPPPLPCPRCPRCFRTPQGLKFHTLKSHREPPPESPPQHLGDP